MAMLLPRRHQALSKTLAWCTSLAEGRFFTSTSFLRDGEGEAASEGKSREGGSNRSPAGPGGNRRGPQLQRRTWQQPQRQQQDRRGPRDDSRQPWGAAAGGRATNDGGRFSGNRGGPGGRGGPRQQSNNRDSSPRGPRKDFMKVVLTPSATPDSTGAAPKKGAKGQQRPAVTIEKALNRDMLPMLPYMLTEEESSAISRNQLSPRDARLAIEKVRAALVHPPSRLASMEQAEAAAAADPDLHLDIALMNRPSLETSASANDAQVDSKVLDNFKVELKRTLGLTDDEFEEYKQQALQAVQEEESESAGSVLRDVFSQEAELEETLQANLPRNEGYVAAAVAKLKVLQANPNWPHDRKVVFAKRLLKQLA